jgi:predicted DCC family thiol-disulfide oxidoreductase YuxK
MNTLDHVPIVLFDGVCNFCNFWVNFLIDQDKSKKFKFAAYQSDIGQSLLTSAGYTQMPESVMFIYKGKSYTSSSAVLSIAREMPHFWKLLYVFILIPPFIRNPLYNWVAKNRYKWFGKQDACRIPTPDIKSRFLAP